MKVSSLPAAFLTVFASLHSIHAATVIWTNDTANNAWSTAGNWDPATEPTATSEVIFPASLAGAITTTTTENALSLKFEDDYTLSGGTLALAAGNSIETTTGVTASILNALNITGGLTKTGPGTLILQGSNTNPGGTVIEQGKIRAQSIGAMGAAGALTTIKDGATLEIGPGITLDRPVSLEQGAILAGSGTSASNGVMTVDPAATLVHLATSDPGDIFTLGNGANDLTGGAATSVIQPLGPSIVRLATASNYAGSWLLDQGRLELGNATALGSDPTQSITLAGGTLAARASGATNFTGSPGNQLVVTADSTILIDRTFASAGLAYTFGGLSMAGQTLTIAPGPNATSGTASIIVGTATLAGNPNFQIEAIGANGRLEIGTLDGGASPRTLTKTGGGELAINGGANTLITGSALNFSGGGMLDLIFPDLGTDAVIPITATQNPLGHATLALTDGILKLQANGANNATAQTYQIPTPISLAGNVTLDPLRRSGSATNKTYEFTGLTLADGTDLSISGANTHGIRLTGPLALQGDATLGGVNTSFRSGLLTLDGGITGGAGDALEIRGGSSPINLTISAASTYGGGTTITGGNVTLNTANALGLGPITISGGSLRNNDVDFLANNAITLNGGTLEFRNNTAASFNAASLTISGNSTLLVGNNGAGFNQPITLPDLEISGNTTLNLTSANSFSATIPNVVLGGNITFNTTTTTRLGTITEDATPRTLTKSGAGTLELEAASTHSGGTEVLAGVLLVKHEDALGSGLLTLGDTTGTSAATVRFNPGLSIATDLLVRDGSTGARTLDANAGNLTWSGNVDLERLLVINNGSSTLASTLSGEITGSGTLAKSGVGEWILTNPANNFGGGQADAIAISQGSITIANDSALGNIDNGITLTTSGVLRADATFTTARPFTFSGSGATSGIQVSVGETLTLNSPLNGSGNFNKTGPGTVAIAPTVDSSATRGSSAITTVSAGTIRVQSPKGLGDATPLTATGGGTFEFLSDSNTNFAHPLVVGGVATVHVDRAAGGSATNGRHQLGTLALNANGNLTATGANGYGLTLGDTTLTGSQTLSNAADAPMLLENLIANPTTVIRTFTIGGAGDIHVVGEMIQPSGTGDFNITKNGAGTFRFGTAVSAFNAALNVRDGTIDLNNLDHSIGLLTLGGAVAANGASVVTHASGSLTLTNGLTFGSFGPAPNSFVVGNLILAPVAHTFFIPNSTAATAEVTIDGPITGSPGSAITKTSSGILRFTGSTHNTPGPVAVNGGTLELAKTDGAQALGTDALTLNGGTVRLLANNQIPDATTVTIGNTVTSTLNLNDFTETLGGATLSQSSTFEASILATGADGTLVLSGDLHFQNNGNSGFNLSRNTLITGTGTRTVAANDGTLDLGGATRTIHVATTTEGANVGNANATIETRIINGGITKTGPQALVLTHPDNSFAGGLHIADGTVRVTSLAALGTGPVTFAQSGGGVAALDFGATTGTRAGDITVSGSGDGAATILFSAPSPQSLELTGDIDLQSTLTVNVENGTRNDDGSAMLELSGRIDDGEGTNGLVKTGNGILRLAAGNTFGGSTVVRRGVLSIPSDDALGDTDAALVLDGGLLHATASITSPRALVFGDDGGGLRIDSPGTLEFTGDVEWGSGTTSFHGSGMTILSGQSVGAGGDLRLGLPMEFAEIPMFGILPTVATGHALSLRGDVALPTGNVQFANHAVLVLGSGDFIRPLGDGPGEFLMPTLTTVGWAAHGADRVVRIHEDDTPVLWGQTTPAFLSQPFQTQFGRLALGHESATHTVIFETPLELNNPSNSAFRYVVVGNGAAELDALMTGGFSNTPDPTVRFRALYFQGDGSSEVSGPLSGRISISKSGEGTMTLSGDNTGFTGSLWADSGTLALANEQSFGGARSIGMWEDAFVDASGLGGPLVFADPENAFMEIYGTLIGSAISPAYFYGYGHITGDLTVPAGTYFEPGFDSTLHIGGDFTIEDGTEYGLYISAANGLVPNQHFNRIRVTGTVTLSGEFDLFTSGFAERVGESFVFILNDGNDPVQGQFDGLPEGAVVDIGDGLGLQITYQANGDGGSVANDVGFTVVALDAGPDLVLAVDGPTTVAPGAEFDVTFTLSNLGPGEAEDVSVVIDLPANADFVGSDPAGTLGVADVEAGGENLTIDLAPLAEGASIQITVTFTAPPTPDTVNVSAYLTGDEADPNPGNNIADAIITVATAPTAPTVITLTSYILDPAAGTGALTLDTIDGRSYTLQRSDNLVAWHDIESYLGDGTPLTIPLTLTEAPEFFRVKLAEEPPAD